ncbi:MULTISPECIES: DUF2589 domain-containing protein [Sphingomonas]|uniref:DUF2589 domain-containing protein n=1 Tax=Sphingomonas trueperi TaxID=53317 RepID=A0A7X5Y071_9SPHN|nr:MULTISPECIES: DUF2589 domain-containing protein [Sphingomonas]NJB98594.1 hypothetical protein [Sphingomonas trueperi]
MLDLSALVSAILVGTSQAEEALQEANYRMFSEYFVMPASTEDAKRLLREAAERAANLPEDADAEDVRATASALAAASAALEGNTGALQPRTVAIDYPAVTKDGTAVHTVHVPLIALVPFSGVQLSRMVFRADLDVQDKGDALKVGFVHAGSESAKEAGGATTSNASLEIVVEGNQAPDGLRKVIEGYERALRAQIPG